MDRVPRQGEHAETLEAVTAAVPLRHRGTGEAHFTTQAVIDAHQQLDEASAGLAHSRVSDGRSRRRSD